MEDWLKRFPELASPQLVNRLRTPGLHIHAIYELAVGVTLKARGLEVEHEKQLGEVTPDRYIRSTGSAPALVIDATTVNRPKESLTKARAVSKFLNAVGRLKIGVKLRVEETDENGHLRINSKVTAEAVSSIKAWLERVPSIGTSIEVIGFPFTVYEWEHGSSAMTTSRSVGKPYHVDPTKFIKTLEAKVSRYGRLEENTALAVAVGADERCGLNLDSLKQILYGRRRLFAHHESAKLSPDVIKHLTSANNKGLFYNKPLLSCVLWVELDYIQGLWTIVPLYNPYARNALPSDTFKRTWLL